MHVAMMYMYMLYILYVLMHFKTFLQQTVEFRRAGQNLGLRIMGGSDRPYHVFRQGTSPASSSSWSAATLSTTALSLYSVLYSVIVCELTAYTVF